MSRIQRADSKCLSSKVSTRRHSIFNFDGLYSIYGGWVALFWWWELMMKIMSLIWVDRCIAWGIRQLLTTRALTDDEKAHVCSMYGDAVWIDKTRICEGSWIARRLRIAYVFLDVIFIGRPMDMGTLIHEMMHRHQYETVGLAYIPRCLYAQWLGGGYTLPRHAIVQKIMHGSESVRHLNYEQQAVLMEMLWEHRISGLADRGVELDLSLV